MNRYKITYGPGYSNLPSEIEADVFFREGAFTQFNVRSREGVGTGPQTVHSIASKAIVHIELVEENIDE